MLLHHSRKKRYNDGMRVVSYGQDNDVKAEASGALTRVMQYASIVTSLFLHLLLFSGVTIMWARTAKPAEKPPSMYVPSYAYQPPKVSSLPASPVKETKPIEKEQDKQAISTATQLRHASNAATNSSTKVTEAINLVGDKKTTPKPLIKLLGKALAAHLVYPKIAMDFRLRGISYVSFVLHPDGSLTDVTLVQSSRAGVLDDEAVSAVSAISPVKNVSQYVSKPEPMVVGIIFN
jgi:TonB family protein